MEQPFADRVRSVPWSDFEGSCLASPLPIPDLLVQLAGPGRAPALAAAGKLWDRLCHQGNTASSAVPTTPFLLEILDRAAPDELTVEIMDILYQFAATTGWYTRNPPAAGEPMWISELRTRLAAEEARFLRFAAHPNQDIAAFAELIIHQLRGGEEQPR